MMIRYFFLAVLALACARQPIIAAELQISSTTFNPNDSSISVSVKLTNNSSNLLTLAAFSIELQITPVSPRRVEFNASSQPETLTNSEYIFYGNSSAYMTSTTPWAVNSSGSGLNNDFVFSDVTDNTLNMNVPANGTKLLANIRLVPGTGIAQPLPGDLFTLTFISAGTSIFDENLVSVPFTLGTGSLSVPVPEPTTYAMAGISLAALAIGRKRSRS